MNTYTEELKEAVADADAVITGIGSEFAVDMEKAAMENEIYLCCKKYLNCCTEAEDYIKYSVYRHELSGGQNKIINSYAETYKKISRLLSGKRYFILTTNTDEVIYQGGFDNDSIAAPCGSVLRLQSGCGCSKECEAADDILEQIYDVLVDLKSTADMENISEEKAASYLEKIKSIIPKCEKCGTLKKFNLHSEKNYDESGYMPQWEKYTRWLQLTLNKKLVLLELGVGFDVPTVIRWPFEKVAMLNYKAWLYRINLKVPQLPAELKEKGTSVNENSFEFINNNFC